MKSLQSDISGLAYQLKALFKAVSPYIDEHTAVVCPQCSKVCCADRHGIYDSGDITFLKALDLIVPPQPAVLDDTSACRYMGATGCSLQRWMRPFRCTLYFCTPLMKSIESGDPKLYRAFEGYFQNLISLRQELTAMVK